MLVGFVGFIGAAPRDLYFKTAADVVALILLVWLGVKTVAHAPRDADTTGAKAE
jgi:hypothetical protein